MRKRHHNQQAVAQQESRGLPTEAPPPKRVDNAKPIPPTVLQHDGFEEEISVEGLQVVEDPDIPTTANAAVTQTLIAAGALTLTDAVVESWSPAQISEAMAWANSRLSGVPGAWVPNHVQLYIPGYRPTASQVTAPPQKNPAQSAKPAAWMEQPLDNPGVVACCATCRFSMEKQVGAGILCCKEPPRIVVGNAMGRWPAVQPDSWCGAYEVEPLD